MRAEYELIDGQSSASTGERLYDYSPVAGRGFGLHVNDQTAKQAFPSATVAYRVFKRVLDIVLVLLLAPVLLPGCLIISVLLICTSSGPLFFSHRRICRNGAFFSMWKFRTMCTNSAEALDRYLADHPEARKEWMSSHKLRHDPRVSAVGAFLRKYSLDELPQIWNVFTGEMSLVGPRPIVAAEVEKYGESFSHYTRVKPGVTGLWQVSGRSSTSYSERVALDCAYVENWSLMGDIKILSRTFPSVVQSNGAF